MLIVQKFHSIHEIDPEFIANLEVLLQEEFPNFQTLAFRHDTAPADDAFTYFLFFGPTQNTPIGFAQICLRKVPTQKLLPWHKKLKFWDKEHEHWKQISWKVGEGHSGLFVIDPKFARTGKEKIVELIKEYALRLDVKAQEFFYFKGMQEIAVDEKADLKWSKESFILEPLVKASKSYQDYLGNLTSEVKNLITQSWKDLHQKNQVELGDYPTVDEAPKNLPVDEAHFKAWKKAGAQILTFEKDFKILGCLAVFRGKNGNIFFEPFPFEANDEAIVSDELYTQYALLKFFEMPDARKCHMMKFGAKLVFEDKKDLEFFLEQGFQQKTLTHTFSSKLPGLEYPL